VKLHHGLLNRVQPLVLNKIFHGHQFSAVDHTQELNAAVHRLISQLAINDPAKRDGAGTAVTLAAAFLRAGFLSAEPQIVKKCLCRPDIVELDNFTAFDEPDRVPHPSTPPIG
jgi:hypothetical protein